MKYKIKILNQSLIICILFIFSCTPVPKQFASFSIKGSDTMLKLVEKLAQEYMIANPGISIYVSGGGSTAGIKALSRGECNIAISSRKLTNEEIKNIAEKYYTIALSYLIARDAVSVYVSNKNPIDNITSSQLKGIFEGSITNWKDINGKDAKIIPIIRNPMSGTLLFFKEHILQGKDFTKNAIQKATFDEVLTSIKEYPNAIGFGGIGTFKDVKHLFIDGIEPIEENVMNDKYPLNRYLYFYTVKTANKIEKDFIDWVISNEGQKIIKTEGYIPIWMIKF